jgi:hypothetical protein
MIVSLLYRVTQHLLSIPGVLLRCETSRDAELLVLRHENTILRRQLGQRLRYQPADRLWLNATDDWYAAAQCQRDHAGPDPPVIGQGSQTAPRQGPQGPDRGTQFAA